MTLGEGLLVALGQALPTEPSPTKLTTLGKSLPTDPAALTALGKGLPTEPYRKNRSRNRWRNSGMIWQADVS